MVDEIFLRLQKPRQSGRRKTVDSEGVLQAMEENPASSDRRVSGEFSGVRHLNLGKSTRSCWIVPRVTKIL